MEHCARAQCRHSGGFSEVYFFAKGDFFVLIANHESAASTTCAPSAPAGAAPPPPISCGAKNQPTCADEPLVSVGAP